MANKINYPDKRFNDYSKKLEPKSQKARPEDSKKKQGGKQGDK